MMADNKGIYAKNHCNHDAVPTFISFRKNNIKKNNKSKKTTDYAHDTTDDIN